MLRPSLLLLILLLSGCCDRNTRRIQPHWLRAEEPYELVPVQLSRIVSGTVTEPLEISVGKDTRGDPFNGKEIVGFVVAQNYGFWLDLTNKGGESIRLLWPEARYVDELGTGRTVYAQRRGALPDERDKLRPPPAELIEPGGRSRPTVVPIYKQYLVASGCRDLYPYSEPLVPTRLDDKNEKQMKAYVDDLARRQVPVKLFLPIEIDGKRYEYTFAFVLKDRWADLPKE
jgi:hypothetical protein